MSRVMCSLVCGLLLGACDEAPVAASLSDVPERFVGVWDASLADCAAGGGPQAVSVAARAVVFADSRLAVTGVAPDGETAARVDGHFSGPGAEWDGSVRLELADGGAVLNVVNGSTIVPRVRCP